MGDFNIDWKDKMNPNFDNFSRFCDICSMSNRIKDYTCFTKTHKSSIDLILTNKEHSFELTKTTETGVTDVHLLLLIFMKSETTCLPPNALLLLLHLYWCLHLLLHQLHESRAVMPRILLLSV